MTTGHSNTRSTWHRRSTVRVIAVYAAIIVLSTSGPVSAQDACTALAAVSIPDTSIVSAKSVPANASTGTPSFCEVQATLSPVVGSRIGAVYRLPSNWNGKILGIGGGGSAGNVTLEAAAEGLARGYAVVQNDLGHSGTSATDWSFAVKAPGQPNTEAIIDFGHRATHTATVVGKDLVSRFYQRPARHSYWQGCSTGGRQGLAEVQRYPADYDGVIAGAPVYSPLVYSNAILRVQTFHAKPESNLLPAHVPLIQKAVLAACDVKDGVVDGILNDPRACTWDPGELACKGPSTSLRTSAASAECLTPAQVETVRRAYAGVKTRDGRSVAMPLMRGGESDWVARMIGTPQAPRGVNAVLGAPFASYVVMADPAYDIMKFDPERDMAALNRGLAAEHVHQQNPDISAFVERGGKLLLWHGFNDPGPSPLSTIEYFDAVKATVPAATDAVRLFLAPGVLHCRGGAGPDRFDALTALENWVEKGTAPASMLATKANSPLSRPLCPYPQLPRYKGSGDTNDASSFVCSAP
jgi:feruloyl esterase